MLQFSSNLSEQLLSFYPLHIILNLVIFNITKNAASQGFYCPCGLRCLRCRRGYSVWIVLTCYNVHIQLVFMRAHHVHYMKGLEVISSYASYSIRYVAHHLTYFQHEISSHYV